MTNHITFELVGCGDLGKDCRQVGPLLSTFQHFVTFQNVFLLFISFFPFRHLLQLFTDCLKIARQRKRHLTYWPIFFITCFENACYPSERRTWRLSWTGYSETRKRNSKVGSFWKPVCFAQNLFVSFGFLQIRYYLFGFAPPFFCAVWFCN